jgi:tol-pal system protein YbgF
MKLLPLVSLALLFVNCASAAADKSILELQRDMALLQDEMRTLEQRIAGIQTLMQQIAQQNSDAAAKSDARMDKFQSAVQQAVKSEVGQLSAPIAGVGTKLDSVSGEVTSLRDASGETTRQITSLRSQMDEMNNVLKALQTPAAAPPSPEGQPQPSKLFTDASADINRNQDLALMEFADFLRLFPNDALAPQAQFNVGQIHYGQNQFDQAAQDFDAVLTKFPNSQQVPDAMYMKGLSLVKALHRPAAAEVFKALIAKFPQSSQASQAKDLLRALTSPAPGAPRKAR